MTTELATQFAVTVRGYDRAQVEDYVDTLREWLGNATLRMETAESENAHLREQLLAQRARLVQLDEQVVDNPPRTIQALGERITKILQLAEEGATAVQGDAEAEAVSILGRARQEAADLVRVAQSRQAELEAYIAGAGEQATALRQQAEARGAEAANRLLAEAEAQRERVLAQLGEEQATLRAEVQRLVAERDEIRDGLIRLRESLHRTLSELPGSAPPPPASEAPSEAPGAPPPDRPAR